MKYFILPILELYYCLIGTTLLPNQQYYCKTPKSDSIPTTRERERENQGACPLVQHDAGGVALASPIIKKAHQKLSLGKCTVLLTL